MNYKEIYDSLIDKRRNIIPSGYCEVHHIIPRCMKGSDEPSNLVKLTPEEHYIAHKLLAKIYPTNYKIIKSLLCMGMKANSHERHFNKSFGWARRQFSKLQSGSGNPFYGKTHTLEHKEYMRNLMKGRKCEWRDKISRTKKENPIEFTIEHRRKISIANSGENHGMFGKTHTLESRRKISESRKGIIPSNARSVTINNITYSSIAEASAKTGISKYKIRQMRLNCENY